jgi:aspartokinase-like uncharacterized kinase
MTENPLENTALTVIKVGGGLAGIPDALKRVCGAVQEAARSHRIVIVPGGGPFAEAVREFDQLQGLSSSTAHWMALLAMDQYAHVLADRMPGAVLLDDPGSLPEVLAQCKMAVLAPARWMRSADVLPHSWDVTSDSIAAFIAGALGASGLILIKPVPWGEVDSYFATALPSGLPVQMLSWDEVEALSAALSGQSAGDAPG